MYYAEKLINGKLCWRSNPHGEWQEFSYEIILNRMLSAEHKLDEIANELRQDNLKYDIRRIIDRKDKV